MTSRAARTRRHMKKLLAFSILLFALCGLSMAATRVAHTGLLCDSSCGSTTGINTAGATLILISCANTVDCPAAPTSTPSTGTTWHHIAAVGNSGCYGGYLSGWYTYGSSIGASSQTFTISSTGGSFQVEAWSGTPTTSDPLRNTSGTYCSSTPGSLTPPAGDLVFSSFSNGYGDTTTFAVDSSFTVGTSNHDGSATDGAIAYLASAPGTALNPSWAGSNGSYRTTTMWDFVTGAGAPALTASPSTVPASHSTNISLSLTCSTCSWTSSTTFSVSGVTGAAFVSKTNISATSETVVITTGSGTGTLTITGSDTSTGTITVSTPTLTVSPTTATTGTTPTVALTGLYTIWATDVSAGNFTTSSLFSASGSTGASIGSCTISSNTAASCTLTAGSTAATDTITDNSTTKTATVTVSSGTTYALTTATSGTGSSYVTISGCAGNYTAGQSYSCSISVSPSAAATLTGVTGCGGSGTTTYTGSMPAAPCQVTATATLNTYALTIATAGTGSGSISGTNCTSGNYNYGTAVGPCTATPSSSTFAGWTTATGNATACLNTTGTCPSSGSFTLTTPTGLTATFNSITSGGGVVIR